MQTKATRLPKVGTPDYITSVGIEVFPNTRLAFPVRVEQSMIQPERPHFYKYVTAEVAKIILVNRKLRYSAPSAFNDPFDTQFDLHLPFDPDDLREATMKRFLDAVNSDTPLPNADKHFHAGATEEFRKIRSKIGKSDKELRAEMMPLIEEGIGKIRESLPFFQAYIVDEMRKLKVLCVSDVSNNILMWSHYSQYHTGAVIKLLCIPGLDNALCAATKVTYRENMPTFTNSIEEFIEGGFGFNPTDYRKIMEELHTVKSIDWNYEKEWRVVIFFEDPNTKYNDFDIYPQEIGEIIFGCRMSEQDRDDILSLLTLDLGHVTATQASKNPKKFALDFEPVQRAS